MLLSNLLWWQEMEANRCQNTQRSSKIAPVTLQEPQLRPSTSPGVTRFVLQERMLLTLLSQRQRQQQESGTDGRGHGSLQEKACGHLLEARLA